MSAALPNVEQLYAQLLAELRPRMTPDTGIVGVVTGGVWLAERLHRDLGVALPLGTLDVSYYRDDFDSAGLKKHVRPTQIPFDVPGRSLVLVDDVLYTGRTTRGAMDALFRGGRPKRVQLCVLIDRGHRELPIEAAFVGRMVQTSGNQIIEVKLKEIDDAEKVLLREKHYDPLGYGQPDIRA